MEQTCCWGVDVFCLVDVVFVQFRDSSACSLLLCTYISMYVHTISSGVIHKASSMLLPHNFSEINLFGFFLRLSN